MIRANLAGAVLCFAMMACASASTQVKAPQAKQEAAQKDGKVAANDKKDIVCRMERPTGSNIPERVCRYVGLEQNEQTQRTQDVLRGDQRGSPGPLTGN